MAKSRQTAPDLVEARGFGPNPGGLRMFVRWPSARAAPLVVVLHGCGQSAEAYARGAGWIALAERFGFALVCPQQKVANNLGRCFNWFQRRDAARGRGEAASIRAMVDHALAEPRLDRRRVFITGLSAGGAMTAVMLAAYPEVFAGGAIIAGMPCGAAENLSEGLAAMAQGADRPAKDWAARARAAGGGDGPWPRVSIWQGEADSVVNPANARELVKQWTRMHGLGEAAPSVEVGEGFRRRVWRDRQGRALVESVSLPGLGHGAPVAATGPEGLGEAGPFLIEAGVSSSLHIARFWGLADASGRSVDGGEPSRPRPALGGLRGVVARALTALGLMK
jgi:feruloyl esterase